ncbi:MAG: DUF3037 domain-containing protein [Anaerolineales bacterium]
MASKYSVIQFIPNPISGECINIGVLAFEHDKADVRFVTNWSRVKRFAGVDITFLKSFARELEESTTTDLLLPGFAQGPRLNEEIIQKMIGEWANSVQFTETRVSVKPLSDLIDGISKQFLTQPAQRGERPYRDRTSAIKITKIYIRTALEERVGKEQAAHLLQLQQDVEGKYGPHTFDAVIANGRPYMAFQAVSFELPIASELDQTVDALAFKISDVRQINSSLPIGVLALPPKSDSHGRAKKIYDRALLTYKGLDASVITENGAPKWMREQVKRIPISEDN